MRKTTIILVIIMVGILVVAGCSQKENDVVATVNGEEILREDYELILDQYKFLYAQQGLDLDNANEQTATMLEMLKEQVLDELISTALVMQEAANNGIQISEELLQEEISAYKEGYTDEEFASALVDAGITEEQLAADIKKSLTIEKYIAFYMERFNEDELVPTTEEINERYEVYKAEIEDIPDLEELYEYLEWEITEEKNEVRILELLENLRENSEIQILL